MRPGHIALSVSDLSRSILFYRRFFGLRTTNTYAYPERGFSIVLMHKEGLTLELFEFRKHKPLPAYRRELDHDLRTIGVKHFSVEVDRIRPVHSRFLKAGVAMATPLRRFDNGARYFFIKDPDGILIEIMEAL